MPSSEEGEEEAFLVAQLEARPNDHGHNRTEEALAAAHGQRVTSVIDQLQSPSPTRNDAISTSPSSSAATREEQKSAAATSRAQESRLPHESIPALPAIPAKHLRQRAPNGPARHPTSGEQERGTDDIHGALATAPPTADARSAPEERVLLHSRASPRTPPSATPHHRDAVGAPEEKARSRTHSAHPTPARGRGKSLSALSPVQLKRRPATTAPSLAPRPHDDAAMARRDSDLFMELAEGEEREQGRPLSRATGRLSQYANRRSLPADAVLSSPLERRPKSSGSIFQRSASRLGGDGSSVHRSAERPRDEATSRLYMNIDDGASASGRSATGRTSRFSMGGDRERAVSRKADRVTSPEVPSFGRRRPSFGVSQEPPRQRFPSQTARSLRDSHVDSPAGSSEPKRSLPDSASVDSETADTVWDELDELKSRIKKLELTGKLPTTSAAAVSGASSERPRTATTAPTTIDSSPKHEKKNEEADEQPEKPADPPSGPPTANIHPLLHAALAKAKPLLNASLYRALEATAADALQLAAMTGSAGPQGTTYTAASIINGVTVSDRHVRRKADMMCRNLTDLCLALCEGKHEVPRIVSSPLTLDAPQSSPTIHYSRSRPGGASRQRDLSTGAGRPMSRLEARRRSILGAQPLADSVSRSGRGDSHDDVSASEHESTPPQPPTLRSESRRISRASSRLLTVRNNRHDDVSGDEDPTVRPPSRAISEISRIRTRPRDPSQPEYSASPPQINSPGLREALAARKTNGSLFDGNRELSRVASLNSDSGRKRWARESTPPVLEEEMEDGAESTPSLSQPPKRRLMSTGQFSSGGVAALRANAADMPTRAASLSSRRQLAVE